jgi:hypothetical protein
MLLQELFYFRIVDEKFWDQAYSQIPQQLGQVRPADEAKFTCRLAFAKLEHTHFLGRLEHVSLQGEAAGSRYAAMGKFAKQRAQQSARHGWPHFIHGRARTQVVARSGVKQEANNRRSKWPLGRQEPHDPFAGEPCHGVTLLPGAASVGQGKRFLGHAGLSQEFFNLVKILHVIVGGAVKLFLVDDLAVLQIVAHACRQHFMIRLAFHDRPGGIVNRHLADADHVLEGIVDPVRFPVVVAKAGVDCRGGDAKAQGKSTGDIQDYEGQVMKDR